MSNIDPNNPTSGQATTESVRDNFQAAADEIDANAAGVAGNASDIAVLQPGGGGDFAAFLAGYEDTGFHIKYSGDLNDIAVNSVYYVEQNATTNTPVDWVSQGILYTEMIDGTAFYTQRLIGLVNQDQWKQWVRDNDLGVWGAWKLVVDGENINNVTGQISNNGNSDISYSFPSGIVVKKFSLSIWALGQSLDEQPRIQIGGAGGFKISAYLAKSARLKNGAFPDILIDNDGAYISPVDITAGHLSTMRFDFSRQGASDWNWTAQGSNDSANADAYLSNGRTSLGEALTQVRVIIDTGTFTGGGFYINYET